MSEMHKGSCLTGVTLTCERAHQLEPMHQLHLREHGPCTTVFNTANMASELPCLQPANANLQQLH